jgi:hypothetical protein
VFLLLHSSAEFHKVLGNVLVCSLEYIDQTVKLVSDIAIMSIQNGENTYDPERPLSCSVKKVMARPSLPARPVLPILCT